MHTLAAWRYHVVALLALSLATSCTSGTASTKSTASGPPATFTQIYSELFPLGTLAQCNYCHDRPANEVSNGMLNMGHAQADTYAAIMGTASMSAKCGGTYTLVVP